MQDAWPIDTRFPLGKLGLFFDGEVQRLIDSFAHCFKVKISIFSARMEEMIVGLQNPGSDFCMQIQKRLNFRHRCCSQDVKMCKQCQIKGEKVIYKCYAGLWEVVFPIKINDKLVGYGILGQFKTGENLPSPIFEIWEKNDFSLQEIKNAWNDLPFFDSLSLDNMLRLFSMMISFIVTREYIRFRHPSVIEKIMQYLEEHIADSITLDDAAKSLHCSRSTISHAVKLKFGMSFKKICTLKKIQRFESIIANDPVLRIGEAAAMVGYDDPLYFSRVYKKMRLVPPKTALHAMSP